MNSAIELVVAGYVATGQLNALQDLKAHREQLAASTRSRTDFNFGVLLGQLDEDIRAIDLGIRKLRAVADARQTEDV